MSTVIMKGKKKGLESTQAGQTQLSPWESEGANNPGNHFEVYKG